MAFCFFSTFWTVSCVNELSMKDVAGRYVARKPFGLETTTLRADGTFSQEIEIGDLRRTLKQSGQWSYDPTNGYAHLKDCLSPCLLYTSDAADE